MKRRLILISIIMLVLLGAGAGIYLLHIRANSGPRLLAKAELAVQAQRFDRAAELAGAYIARFPQDWQGYYIQGHAHNRLGQYDQARRTLQQAVKLNPTEISVILALADTYALPARSHLATQGDQATANALIESVEHLFQANDVLSAFQADDQTASDILQAKGLNLLQIGIGQRLIGRRLEEDAQLAKTRGDLTTYSQKHQDSEKALKESEKHLADATTDLLTVVTEDPSHRQAARALVELCLDRKDTVSLASARQAIMSLENPPALLAMKFAMHDLRTSTAPAGSQLQRDNTLRTARLLDELLQKHPANIEIMLNRADLALSLEDLETAESLCRNVLQADPRQARARLIIAKVLMRKRDWARAEQELFSLRTDFPKWIEAHLAYARVALARGRDGLARDAMRTITELDPAHPAARAFLAESLLKGGFHGQAFQDAQAYFEVHRDDPTAISIFVRCAAATGQSNRAHQELDALRTEYPERPDILAALANAYAFLGLQPQAVDAAKAVAANDSSSVPDLVNAAQALLDAQANTQAEPILIRVLAANSQYAPAYFNLARLYYTTKRNMQALEYFQTAVELDQENAAYRLAYAGALFERGLFEDANQQCRTILQYEPSNTSAILLAEQIAVVQGKPVSVASAIQRIETGARSGMPLALSYLKTGQPDKCIEICLAELEKDPRDINARLVLGDTYLKLGRLDKGRQIRTELLKDYPDKFANYLRLADLLSRTGAGPEKVRITLADIPSTRPEMIEMVVAWLWEKSGNYQAAADSYGRLIARTDAPLDTRNEARFKLAYALAQAGHPDQAVSELDYLAGTRSWHKHALHAKVRILLAAGRRDQANIALDELRRFAEQNNDPELLATTAELYSRTGQTAVALRVCDKLQQLRPDHAGAYLLAAEILESAGKLPDAVPFYRQAIQRQPGSLRLYVLLARNFDKQNNPAEALKVLGQLHDMGDVAASASIFYQGAFFARWGLQIQAVERFEELAQMGYAEDPQLKLSLARAFTTIGQKPRAVALLAEIPPYADQYIPAQRLLAALAQADRDKLEILDRLQEANPDRADILAQKMAVLIKADQSDQAVAIFESFVNNQPAASRLPTDAGLLALQAMLSRGNYQAAADLSFRVAGQSPATLWRRLAVLLLLEIDPARAATFLTDVSHTEDLSEALLTLLAAHRLGDAELSRKCIQRLKEIEDQLKTMHPPRSVPANYRLLAAASTGSLADAQAVLADFPASDTPGRTAAGELLAHLTTDPGAAKESLNLLRATLAMKFSLPTLGRAWALEVLKDRPACQWAAALIAESQPDTALLSEVLDTLEPKNSVTARSIQAELLIRQEQYQKAADLYGLALNGERDNFQLLLQQARALEQAGDFSQALELYRRVWKVTRSPIAANNAANIVANLSPTDQAALAEAQAWTEKAVQSNPNVPAFQDTKGWIAYLQGRPDQACLDLRQAAKGLPDSPEVHYHLGSAELATNNNQLARWHLSAAVALGQAQLSDSQKPLPQITKTVQLAEQALANMEAQPD